MKLVQVTPYSWTTPGGVNAHVSHLAEELRRRGHEACIVAPADGPVPPDVIPVGRSVPVPYNGSVARMAFGPRVAARVRVALRRAQPDVVHVHEPFAPGAAMLAALVARCPVVATFHASADGRAYKLARVPFQGLWRKLAARIAVSDAARATVEAVFGPGTRVIPNGVDVAAYAAVPPSAPDDRTVLFFGRLEPRKGPHVLLDAVGALRERVPDARLVIAGDGPLRARLEAAVPAEHQGAVVFHGRFSDDERVELLAGSAVVCLPAVHGESFGITLAEAMAAGRAVVATDIPGYAAVARNGRDATLVPPNDQGALADALADVLLDFERRARFEVAGRARAAEFDWPKIADALEEVYRAALSAGAQDEA